MEKTQDRRWRLLGFRREKNFSGEKGGTCKERATGKRYSVSTSEKKKKSDCTSHNVGKRSNRIPTCIADIEERKRKKQFLRAMANLAKRGLVTSGPRRIEGERKRAGHYSCVPGADNLQLRGEKDRNAKLVKGR